MTGLLLALGLWGGPGAAMAVGAAPGEILLNNFLGSNIQRYGTDGTLLQTYTGTGKAWQGVSLTPDGHMVTTYRINGPTNPGVNLFDPEGVQVASFGTSAITNGLPGDVSVFADGTLAINDQDGNRVLFYSQTGDLIRAVGLSGVVHPFGSTVGSDHILYVAGLDSSNIGRVQPDGKVLSPIRLSFQPGDLVMSPLDGTLWVSDFYGDRVVHLDTAGTVLGSFSIDLTGVFAGIGLAPDGQSLYVTTQASTVIRQFDLRGNLLGEFDIVDPRMPLFLAVVPVPEPSGLTLAGVGLGILAAGRWWRSRSARRRVAAR
ncbi:MAG: hypothetical protein IRY99_10300 [Isosphaeraceae bacterium]|nr:hypothetical protein [Isosphaeraceae bacterium]